MKTIPKHYNKLMFGQILYEMYTYNFFFLRVLTVNKTIKMVFKNKTEIL